MDASHCLCVVALLMAYHFSPHLRRLASDILKELRTWRSKQPPR